MLVLSIAEKVELAAIPLGTALVWWLAPHPGFTAELGTLVAGGALAILLQGFLRDLWLLREARRQAPATPVRAARCMCVESALGLTGVVAGVALTGIGLTRTCFLSPTGLTAAVAAAFVVGFILKDFVFEWSPWKIYREKNHAQVIVRWGK